MPVPRGHDGRPRAAILAQEIAATPTLLHFAAGVRASGTPRLAAGQPVTVIAMTDDAYGRLAPEVPESLLAPDNHACWCGWSIIIWSRARSTGPNCVAA